MTRILKVQLPLGSIAAAAKIVSRSDYDFVRAVGKAVKKAGESLLSETLQRNLFQKKFYQGKIPSSVPTKSQFCRHDAGYSHHREATAVYHGRYFGNAKAFVLKTQSR